MKDQYGRELNKDDPVWFILPICSGKGTIVKITKSTCHVLCAGEIHKGLYPRDLSLWKDEPSN